MVAPSPPPVLYFPPCHTIFLFVDGFSSIRSAIADLICGLLDFLRIVCVKAICLPMCCAFLSVTSRVAIFNVFPALLSSSSDAEHL